MGLQIYFQKYAILSVVHIPSPILAHSWKRFHKIFCEKQIFNNLQKFIFSKISHPMVFDAVIMLLISTLSSGYACIGLVVIETFSDY